MNTRVIDVPSLHAPMIHFLASVFRMFHRVIGVTAPEPGHDERSFVFMWLALIVFVLLFCWLLLYLMANMF